MSRFRITILKLERGEPISCKEWSEIQELIDILKKQDIEIVHTEISKSVRVWLLCRRHVAVLKLQKMVKDGRLEDILIKLFSIFLKREVRFTRLLKRKGQLKMKFRIAPEQYLQAQEYFETFGSQLVIISYFRILSFS